LAAEENRPGRCGRKDEPGAVVLPGRNPRRRREKMKRRVGWFLGGTLAVAILCLLAGQLAVGEETMSGVVSPEGARAADDAFVSCTGWLNCNEESPNYTGYCCRCCRDKEAGKRWHCKRKSPTGEQLDASVVDNAVVGEATISGIVTRESILKADDGRSFAVAGEKAEELCRNMGKKIEVKGTVEEEQGKITIDVETYELLLSGTATTEQVTKLDDPFVSCTEWANCSTLPPTFTGTCCRQCMDTNGGKIWDCKVFSAGEYFDLAEWSDGN
jgi:hypothetical protein